ncbi:MAG TPA: hypothetical protein VMB80_18510 [Candidatus Acidoferrum sp.]|nr:hypothetical protein [Candidatus Acidoferrum sp.]
MKKAVWILSFVVLAVYASQAQILLSGGLSYSQNFDTLANTGSTVTWADNSTLTGWYASRAYTAGTTSAFGPTVYPSYRVSDGSTTSGWLYSYGAASAVDRALGSLSSGTPKTNAFGVLIQNDTASTVNNVLVTYTGEQWRNGGNTAAQTLAFSYSTTSSSFLLNGALDTAPAGSDNWVAFTALDFISPTTGSTAAALDGNNPANQVQFNNVLLTGVSLNPGDSLFLRWVDIDDPGNDHGFGVDNFSVSFSTVPEPSVLALGGCLTLLGLAWRNSRRK